MKLLRRAATPRRLGGVLLLSLALAGCAIKTPHLAITQWPIEARAAYYQDPLPYRVAVLPFEDHRPANERAGQRAPATFLLLWNRRVGDYYTGDHVFGGNVRAQLAQELAAYLRAANAFTDVNYYPATESTASPAQAQIQQLGRSAGADYLLTTDLQHFFGSQHQEFSMFLLPLYFLSMFGWQEGKGLPWGRTVMVCSLYDAGQGELVWRHRIETDETLPTERDSMAEAALESFALAAGQVATEIRNASWHDQQRTGGTP
ncbi:MAG: hypothetical protein HY737_01755 [Candidatus Omnitrophica bacterium]|nr:hypothetical protein [Candidatus Omnitrophota bacterium]